MIRIHFYHVIIKKMWILVDACVSTSTMEAIPVFIMTFSVHIFCTILLLLYW